MKQSSSQAKTAHRAAERARFACEVSVPGAVLVAAAVESAVVAVAVLVAVVEGVATAVAGGEGVAVAGIGWRVEPRRPGAFVAVADGTPCCCTRDAAGATLPADVGEIASIHPAVVNKNSNFPRLSLWLTLLLIASFCVQSKGRLTWLLIWPSLPAIASLLR